MDTSNAILYHVYYTEEYTSEVDPETGETYYNLDANTYDEADFTSDDVRTALSSGTPCFLMAHCKNYEELPADLKWYDTYLASSVLYIQGTGQVAFYGAGNDTIVIDDSGNVWEGLR